MYLNVKMALPKTLLLGMLLALFFLPACEQRITVTEASSATPGSGNFDLALNFDGLERSYKLHLPKGYDGQTKLPLVIFLHGGGRSSESLFGNKLDVAADENSFIIAAPDGTGRQSSNLLTWNAGKWEGGECCGLAAKNKVNDVGFILTLINTLKAGYAVDEKMVYAVGISNGGMLAYRLACGIPDEFAAVAAVAPPAVPQNCEPPTPISILHIHGTADPCTPYEGGQGGSCLSEDVFESQSAQAMVAGWVARNGISTAPRSIYKNGAAECISYVQNDVEVEFCSVAGAGHTWPGGEQYLPAGRIGPVSNDISSDQIWEFFSRHHRP